MKCSDCKTKCETCNNEIKRSIHYYEIRLIFTTIVVVTLIVLLVLAGYTYINIIGGLT